MEGDTYLGTVNSAKSQIIEQIGGLQMKEALNGMLEKPEILKLEAKDEVKDDQIVDTQDLKSGCMKDMKRIGDGKK